MSVITVYRHFYWTESRLAGQTGHIWETKEEQARCIKDEPPSLTSGVQMHPAYIPPTKAQQQEDARYHISNQHCLCGIHGYFSPNYLGLMMTSGNGPGAVDREGELVYTRVRLGGLVDIHGMGARGEYGLIEEAWTQKDDDVDLAEAIAKHYDIPVNKSEYSKQPRTDPQLTGEAKIVRMSPLFAGMPEALAMQKSLGANPITPTAVGLQTIITQARAMYQNQPPMAQLFGAPITFKQYMAMMNSNPAALPSGLGPFGNLGGSGPFPPSAPGGLTPSVQPGSTITGRLPRSGNLAGGAGYAPPLPGNFGPPPPWTSQLMRSVYNNRNNPPAPCSAPPGSNCQCGACAFRAAMGPQRGTLGSWRCRICGTYEYKATDHTLTTCRAALPKLLLVPGSIGVDKAHKPGIIARFKRAMGF